jgi:hypothetical protein
VSADEPSRRQAAYESTGPSVIALDGLGVKLNLSIEAVPCSPVRRRKAFTKCVDVSLATHITKVKADIPVLLNDVAPRHIAPTDGAIVRTLGFGIPAHRMATTPSRSVQFAIAI